MARLAFLLALAACVFLPSCGGAQTIDDELAALDAAFGRGDLAEVVERSPALAQRCRNDGAGPAKVWRVEKLYLLAVAKQGHGKQALKHLERLGGEFAANVDGKLYFQVCEYVSDGGNLLEAIDVLHAGVERFPDLKPVFEPQIQDLAARAQDEGNSDATDKLKALGYL